MVRLEPPCPVPLVATAFRIRRRNMGDGYTRVSGDVTHAPAGATDPITEPFEVLLGDDSVIAIQIAGRPR